MLGARYSLVLKAWFPLLVSAAPLLFWASQVRSVLQGAIEVLCSPRPLHPAFFKILFLPFRDGRVLLWGDTSWPLGPGIFLFVWCLCLCYAAVAEFIPVT